jgi:hypothetical protein
VDAAAQRATAAGRCPTSAGYHTAEEQRSRFGLGAEAAGPAHAGLEVVEAQPAWDRAEELAAEYARHFG